MASSRQLQEAADIARNAEDAERVAHEKEELARQAVKTAEEERLSANQKRAAANASHSFADGGAVGGPATVEDRIPRPVLPAGVAGGSNIPSAAGNATATVHNGRGGLSVPALVLAIIAIILAILALGLWLNHREGAEVTNKTANTALTTANEAKAEAKDAKAVATNAAALGESNKTAIGGLIGWSEKAKKDLEEAKAAAAKCAKACEARNPAKPARPSAGAPSEPGHQQTTETIWLWHHHKATAKSPSMCVIESGDGAGLPPYCSGHKVIPRLVNETKNHWLVRVGGGGRPEGTGEYQHPGTRPS